MKITLGSRLLLLVVSLLLTPPTLQAQKSDMLQKPPQYRVDASGFNASPQDIKKVLDYTIKPMWENFPGYQLEPIVVTRGNKGPIVLYQRNAKKEIVVKLDTHKTFWSQYAYQWAHEFCHVLCGFRNDGRENKWFEETICEMASLYCMRNMGEEWTKNPPYPSWKGYAPSLKKYAANIMVKRKQLKPKDLAAYYQKHKDELRKSSTLRELNGTMAMAMLPAFEKNPSHWEAVRYLNTSPAKKGITLKEYFAKWRKDSPKKHHALIDDLMKAYGVS